MTTFLKNMLIFQYRDQVVVEIKINMQGNAVFVYLVNQ